ncbi:MAG TPA: hypothetical protein PLC40_11880, partial [Candidatus Hydrogenedentes bacterium]|nr:hypothetical protein [Candidatus Hydrogenedentota bacterium]
MSAVPPGIKIPEQPQYTRSLVRLSVRPQRLAFILDTALSQTDLLEIVEYNSSVWGGFYNLMVPCNNGSITSDYWAALRRYDPDRIIFCGEISQDLQDTLIDGFEPFTGWPWHYLKDDNEFKQDLSYPIHTW